MSDVPEIFDTPPSSDAETKSKVETAMLESLLTDEVQSALKIDVDEFTAKTIMLNERFREVEGRLKDIDSEKLSDPLAPTWSGFRKTYTGLITKSERVAASISKAANSYLTTIVKPAAALHKNGTITKEDVKELKEEIQDFIDENKKSDEEASSIKAGFATLISEIKTFISDKFSKFGENKKSNNEAKLKEIDEKLQTLKNELNAIYNRLGNTLTAIESANAFIPVASLFMNISGALARGASAKAMESVQNEITNKKDEISAQINVAKALGVETDRIIQVRNDLKTLKENQIKDIIDGLEFFRGIWAAIATDTQQIGEYMQSTQTRAAKPRVPPSLEQYLKNTTTLYHGLSKGLVLYSMGVLDAKKKLDEGE